MLIFSTIPEVVMIVVADSVPEAILLDVEQAYADLRQASDARETGDDAEGDARLRQCRARLDGLLDMWNEAGIGN